MFTFPNTKPLSEAQIEEYYREGYTVAKGLAPHNVIDRAVQASKRKLNPDDLKSWYPVIFNHEEPNADPDIHELLVTPNVIAAAEQIMEAPARVYYGMMADVPAHGGKGLEWHQDNQYDQLLGRALNVFIALCDITPDKAILWVSPRSHLNGTQPDIGNADKTAWQKVAADPANGIPLPTMKKGDVAIFDRNTLHRSLKNETNEHRYAYAAQYMETNARSVRLEGKKDISKMLAGDLHSMWQRVKV